MSFLYHEKKVMWRQKQRFKWCGHKPRDASSHQSLEKARNDCPQEPPERLWHCRCLAESGQTDFILQGSRTLRKLTSLALGHPRVVVCCAHYRKLIQHHHKFTVTNYYRFPWFYSLFASSWPHSQTLRNYYFSFCSVRLHCISHCTHNFVDSSSGCYVTETMYISHQWSSQTNYFSSQNKYLSNGMPIKSSNYTLKKCNFKIHYLKTVYYRCSSFNVYLSGKWFSWVTQRRQNIINYLNIYNIVFVFYCWSLCA